MELIINTLVILVGLFLTVGAPILKHSNKIQQVVDRIDNQQKEIRTAWDRLNSHEKTIDDHEIRITVLEHDKQQEEKE